MRKVIALLLTAVFCVSVISCAAINDFMLDRHAIAFAAEKQSTNYDDLKDKDFLAFLEKLQSFSARLTAQIGEGYGNSGNFVISPISVCMALSLACECATGETRQEILDAVGVTYEEVNKYAGKLYAYANVEYMQSNGITKDKQVVAYQSLNNSIWLDDSIEFIEHGVNKLATDYNCDVFHASASNGEMGRLIKKYIYNKTNGLINGDVNLPDNTIFVLMNTYYLKEIWNEFGNNLSFAADPVNFQNGDGSTVRTKLLKGYYNNGKVYDGENFTSFFTATEHNFKIYFFLPDEELSARSIFTEENINTVLDTTDWGHVDDENRQLHYTRVLFPEFKAEFDADIADVLSKSFGIKSLFDINTCDMSNIVDGPVECAGVYHKVSLIVNKKGIEGASVVYIPGAGAAAPPPYEKVYHDFIIDRDFGFVITDRNGTVVFSGIINTID